MRMVITVVTAAFCAASAFASADDMDLYLLVGQSNMAGRGDLNDSNRLNADRIFKLDAKGKWQRAEEPIHFDKKSAGAGLAASFARAMADKNKDVRIGLIPCAVGGTHINRWVEGGDLWSNAVVRTRIALKNGKLKGILWHQGESDATQRLAPQWGAKFESMIKSFRREFGEVPFIAGELGGFLEAYRGKKGERFLCRKINTQLHALEGRLKAYRVVSSDGLKPKKDDLHFNTESLRLFGLRYAQALDSIK